MRLTLGALIVVALVGGEARAEGDPEAETDAEADPEAETEGDPEAETETETEAEAETEAEIEGETEGPKWWSGGDQEVVPLEVPEELEESPAALGGVSGVPEGIDPPLEWKAWSIEGDFIDPPEVIRGFLEPVMERNRNWRPNHQRNVIDFCLQIGYYATLKSAPLDSGGVRAVVELTPIERVRRVVIEFSNVTGQVREPVFEEDIRRRMRLRPGAALGRYPEVRAEQLRSEEERIEEYLLHDGFFEAEVDVRERPDGPYAVRLDVSIDKGPAYRVGRISVIGNETIPSDVITEQFSHDRFCILQVCVGERRFSRQQLNEDVEAVLKMYQRRGFPGARVRTDFSPRSFMRNTKTVEFNIIVNERRKIDVVFEGLSERFSHDRLAGLLQFASEGNYDDVTVEASAREIRSYYQSRGYYEAYVTWERERFEFFDRIIFSIEEGPRLRVRSVRFSGNEGIGNRDLRDEIKTTEYEVFGLLQEGGYATSVQLEQDVERLVELYRARGYLDADVSVKVARSEELLDSPAALAAASLGDGPTTGLHVRFDIEEGDQVTVNHVTFEVEGQSQLDPAALRTVLRVRSGDLFVPERVEQDRDALKRYYFDRGFPRAEVESTWREAADPSQRVVVHRIRENARKRVGKIALRGNFKTDDWILIQELQLSEGDLLTANSAQLAQANLRQSGLFSGVQLRYFGVEDSRRETVDLIVRVDERHDHRAAIEAGGGWSTDSSIFLETIGRMDNIGGVGARLDTRLQAGVEIQAAESKLVFPRWLLERATGRPFVVEVSGFWRNETTERFGDLETFGGNIAATREWRRGFFRNWFLSLRYSFRQLNREQDLIRPSGASGDLSAVPVRTRTSGIGPHLVIDKRRDEEGRLNPLAPAKGFRIDLRTLFAEDRLLGSDRFIKLGGSLQHYLSLTDRLRLSNGFRYDHGIPLGGDVLLPEVERFFAGGDTTVRGFEEDRLATEILESNVPPLGVRQFRVVPASGNIRFIHNLDLQLEVWELGPFPVATAVFLDSGFVVNSLDGLARRDLRHALGVSLFRYVTPFGSLSAEWAIPLNPRLGDDPRGRFHVNVGATLQF